MHIDDRLLWIEACANPAEVMRTTILRSTSFDTAFHLKCEASKCAAAAHPGYTAFAELAASLGYKQEASLDMLGVSINLEKGVFAPLKRVLDKVLWRMRFIKRMPVSVNRKLQLLQSLAF